ncbi:hypothetical protein JOB18_030563, partial [Solea senegalensis]
MAEVRDLEKTPSNDPKGWDFMWWFYRAAVWTVFVPEVFARCQAVLLQPDDSSSATGKFSAVQ